MPVDQKARSVAEKALTKIADHEAQCAERWAEARSMMADLSKRWWWLIGLIITGQGAVIMILMKP